ncbi:hypothetical protein ACJX0J_002488 (mitochondrion) [Zea mays]
MILMILIGFLPHFYQNDLGSKEKEVLGLYQMGYIKLACPVTHVWYLKGLPSYIISISPFFSTPGFLLIGGFGFANYFIIENSVVEWKELEDEGYSGDEWEGMAGTR